MQNKEILEQKRFAQYPLSKKSKKIFLCKLESLRSLKRENFQTFKLSNIRLLPSVMKAFCRTSMCRMYLIRCDNNTLVARFIFVTKSSQENAQ